MNKLAIIFAVAALCAVASADHYAVLVAGSNGFYNYRHQADVCHAYHVLIKAGMPADNIIVMSYDDVAPSSENPFPNELYNKPGDDSVEYNAGCVKNYTGRDVTPDNFVAILTGDASSVSGGDGKVLTSTKDDKVFINFVDHGGAGLIGFPSQYLYADDLNAALQKMHDNDMYSELTFYMEACESGSMFQDKLPEDINIYATTAANATESSWGYYCPPNDKVKGKSIGSCLGDLYSINWMEDSDSHNLTKETLAMQFTNVKKLTTKSHVLEFGTTDFKSSPVADFVGNKDLAAIEEEEKSAVTFSDLVDSFLADYPEWAAQIETPSHAVDSRDIKLMYLLNRLMNNMSSAINQERVLEEVAHRKKMDQVFSTFATAHNVTEVRSTKADNFACYKEASHGFRSQCFGGGMVSEYGLKFMHYLHSACKEGASPQELEQTFANLC